MTRELAMKITDWLWAAWFAFWLLAALRSKATKMAESPISRASYSVWLIAGSLLVFSDVLPDFLQHRFIATTAAELTTGIGITCAGLLFTFWARYCLGANWSGRVTIKHDHELVRSGPYARVRHPIYTGLIVALVGTALVVGTWRGLAGLALVTIGFIIKAQKEDAVLKREFGEAFAEHKRNAGLLLPRLFLKQ